MGTSILSHARSAGYLEELFLSPSIPVILLEEDNHSSLPSGLWFVYVSKLGHLEFSTCIF